MWVHFLILTFMSTWW